MEEKKRMICEVAREIRAKWPKPYFGAVPYLEAMQGLRWANDVYGMEDAKGIVIYFLANASTFRGPDAKRLKAELKGLVGA